jgi:hypothetical protein
MTSISNGGYLDSIIVHQKQQQDENIYTLAGGIGSLIESYGYDVNVCFFSKFWFNIIIVDWLTKNF